jgi:hypothetical protein
MEMGKENGTNAPSVGTSFLKILIDIALGIDDDGCFGLFVGNHIRGMR